MFLSLKRHLLVFNGCKYKAKYFFLPNYIAIFRKLASFFICFSAHIDKKLTVFAGENGAGKSTVLQTLLILKQSHDVHDISVSEMNKLYLNDYYCNKLRNVY